MEAESCQTRNGKGQFTKGSHWREQKPYWVKSWLQYEYTIMCKSATQIAKEQGCRENNILYFLNKHNVPRRTMRQIRKMKHWSLPGELNGMFGRSGESNPNWRGGVTPERQLFYVSDEWKAAAKNIWGRDKFTCQKCSHKKTNSDLFHIHHIVPFTVVELRTNETNLILLCKKCHNWVHSKKNTQGEYIEALLDSK